MKLRQQAFMRASVVLLMALFVVSVAHARQNQNRDQIRMEPIYKPYSPAPAIQLPPPHIERNGNELQASAIKRVLPNYPSDVKPDQLSGIVIVKVQVSKEGNVQRGYALTGHPLFGKAATEALRGWKWEPTLIDGVAQEVWGKIRFDFDGHGTVSINTSDDPGVVDPTPIYRAALLKKLEGYLAELRASPSPALYEKVAQGYFGLSRIQEAIETYKEGISRFPREIALYMGWAGIYFKQGMIGTHGEKNQPEEALKVLELAAQIKLEPDNSIQFREQLSYVFWYLGITYVSMNRNAEAKESLERILSLKPPEKLRDILYLTLGETYVKLGDKDSAITMSQKLLELGKTQTAIDLLGSLYHKLSELGDKQSAKAVMELMSKIYQMKVPKPNPQAEKTYQ